MNKQTTYNLNVEADPEKKANFNEIWATWKRLVETHNRMELTVLDLLAHPDTTPEQIATVQQTLIDGRKHMREHYELVFEKIGNSKTYWFRRVPRPTFMEPRNNEGATR